MDYLRHWFSWFKRDGGSSEFPQVSVQMNMSDIIDYIKSGKCTNIVTIAGAGISKSAEIPDFQNPIGSYSKVWKSNLFDPQAIFEIDYFEKNPGPFYALAKELISGSYKPTPCHYFLKMLHDKGLLLRHYTQNMDALERIAGIPEEKIVEAHGTFYTSHCINKSCDKMYSFEWMGERLQSVMVPKCPECNSVIKPDVVLFGESLPDRFFEQAAEDFQRCDLLIILGTSLVVWPFATLVDQVPLDCSRLCINLKSTSTIISFLGTENRAIHRGEAEYLRDVTWNGDCDEGCRLLAAGLGWQEELEKLIKTDLKRLEAEKSPGKGEEDEDRAETWGRAP